MTPNKETIKSAVINCLKNIYDPEIPVIQTTNPSTSTMLLPA